MYEWIRTGDRLDWAFTQVAFDRLPTQYGEVANRLTEHQNTAFYVCNEIPIELGCSPERLTVFGFDDHGLLAVVAMFDDVEAIAWGNRLIAEYHQGAIQDA